MSLDPRTRSNSGAAASRAGLGLLVERHTPFVRRYLRVLGAQPGQELDDLQQETFLAMLQGSFVDRGDAPTRAFLRRGARLAFLKRHRGWLPQVEAADEVWDRRCGAESGGDGYVEALRACVGKLDGRARKLLDATYRDGLGRADAGCLLQLSADGVKSALRRIRVVLQDCIERRRKA